MLGQVPQVQVGELKTETQSVPLGATQFSSVNLKMNQGKLTLAGGSSKVPGLVDALRQEFSLPVEIFNPFQKIGLPVEGAGIQLIEQNAGQMAVAVGLALRSFENL